MFKCPHCGKSIPDKLIYAHAGHVSGKKLAKKDPDHFRKLQAKRKHRRGGRPPKEK